MDKKKIGRRLRELRGVYRTQADVAKAVGVKQVQISIYERGVSLPRDDVKKALADYFGKTVDEIFFTSN